MRPRTLQGSISLRETGIALPVVSFLFRAAFAASLFAFQPALAQEQLPGSGAVPKQTLTGPDHSSATAVPDSRIDSGLSRYLAAAPQFILLGSTRHTLSDLTFLASEEFLDALVQGGVRNVFLEIPRAQQPVLDGHASVDGVRFANMRSGEMKAAHRFFALLIARAHAKRLHLIAYDFNAWSGAPSLAAIRNDALRCYAENSVVLEPEDPFAAQALHAERLAHDGDAAAFIKSRAGGAKSLIFGGAEHTARKDGLAFELGRSQAAVLHLTKSAEAYSDFVDALESLNNSLPQTLFNEAPDALLTLSHGSVEPPPPVLVRRIHGLRPGRWPSRLCPRRYAALGG